MWTRRSILASGAALAAASLLPASHAFAATDQLRVALQLEPPHLDPTSGAAAAIKEVSYQNIFEGLTAIDQNGGVQPALAKSWTVSSDGLTYTFALQPEVRFHDGTSFDADHVVFSLKRIGAPISENAQKSLYEVIASVTAPDPATVKITLKHPDGNFLFNLGRGDAAIVAPESADNNKSVPIGTGPFAFVEWDQGSRVVLERNEDYWGVHPRIAGAIFVFISDPSTAINAMLANDIDGFPNFPAPEALEVFKTNPQYKVVVGTTEGETLLVTNNARKPFADLRVRQAIAHSIDRKAIIDGAMSGYGTPIGSHFAPHHPDYVDLTGTYPYDVATAKKLLADAGFPDGFSTTLKLPPASYARRGGEIVAAQLKAIGITAKIVNVEWADWLSSVFTNKDYDLTIVSHVEPNDIGVYANPNYYFGYNDPTFQAIMAKVDATTDPVARRPLLAEAQKRLADQAVNGYLFELAQVGVWNAKLFGMWVNAPVEGCVLSGIHWNEPGSPTTPPAATPPPSEAD
jgi:peptide/nickel transport system substrate-binding protein